jgi:ABC-type antimicrobial peptide transport system permease subunit
MWTIARQGLARTGLGLLAGVAIGAIGARALASLLYGVTPHDAVTFAGSTTLILATSLVMTMLAAVRALRIDPITVLRRDA